jgi:CRP/FNR family cyclic AMP-dependent transcriptional regulator
MNDEKIIGEFAISSFFRGLNTEQIRCLLPYMQRFEFKKGMVILREGEIADSLYFILRGVVGVYKRKKGTVKPGIATDELGRKIGEVGKGETFGELAIFDNFPRSASCVAETDCTIFIFPRRNFEKLEKENKEISYTLLKNIVKIISMRLRRTDESLVELL